MIRQNTMIALLIAVALVTLDAQPVFVGRADTVGQQIDTANQLSDTVVMIRQTRLFGYAQGAGIFHVASFRELPSMPSCCPSYGSSFDLGIEVGAGALWRTDDSLHAGFRLGYGFTPASFRATEPTVILKPTPIDASFQHALDATFQSVVFAPMAQYYIGRRTYLSAALVMRYTHFSYADQTERLDAPTGAVYLDNGSLTRNQYRGDVVGVQQITVAPELSIGRDFSLDRRDEWMLAVDLGYQLLLPGYVASIDWYSHTLRLQLAISRDDLMQQELPDREQAQPGNRR
jgi:hypothetical protein